MFKFNSIGWKILIQQKAKLLEVEEESKREEEY